MSRRFSRATMACIALMLGCTGIASAAPQGDADHAANAAGHRRLATAATGAQVKTCETPGGSYDVIAPRAAPGAGADPAAVAAVNCTLQFHEERAFPLSVIALALLATVGTLGLVRRRQYDLRGSEA